MSDLDVIKAALVAAGIARVYKVNAVPESPAYPYVVLSPAYGAPQVRTLDGSGDMVGRFAIQFFSKTVDALDDLTGKAFVTFEGREISGLSDKPVAWLEVNSGTYRDPDTQGVLTVTQTFRF